MLEFPSLNPTRILECNPWIQDPCSSLNIILEFKTGICGSEAWLWLQGMRTAKVLSGPILYTHIHTCTLHPRIDTYILEFRYCYISIIISRVYPWIQQLTLFKDSILEFDMFYPRIDPWIHIHLPIYMHSIFQWLILEFNMTLFKDSILEIDMVYSRINPWIHIIYPSIQGYPWNSCLSLHDFILHAHPHALYIYNH